MDRDDLTHLWWYHLPNVI